MPIISNQEPNCRPGDFVSTYPRAVVVCTDLPSSAFPKEADEDWVLPNVSVAVGTFLGMKTREEVDDLMDELRKHGLKMFVLSDCGTMDILSAKVESDAEKMVRTASALSTEQDSPETFRIVGMLMADIFKKTAMVRYCWFFDDGAPQPRRGKGDAGSAKCKNTPPTGKKKSGHKMAATHAPKQGSKWWEFWK
jgi:hypothetical protein